MKMVRQFWASRFGPPVFLFLLTAFTFLRAAQCQFTNHDDPEYIYANPNVRTGLSGVNLKWAFLALNADVSYWHPLTWLSHQLDWQLFGDRPGPHHLTNVWLHVANTLLLFLVLQKLDLGVRSSFFIAGLFAVHPLHVESVAWVAERKDVLYALFWLAALHRYLGFRITGSRTAYGTALCCFCFALMSKPAAVSLPVVLLLIECAFPIRPNSEDRTSGSDRFHNVTARGIAKACVPIVPFILLSVGIATLTLFAQTKLGAVQSLTLQPLSDRVDNAVVSYLIYLRKTIVPSDLCVSYVQTQPHTLSAIAFSILILTGLTWWSGRFIWRGSLVAFGWFWFVLTLLPNIGLIQAGAQSMADRYTYIPLIGVFLMLSGITQDTLRRWRCLGIAEVAAFASLLVCAALSFAQLASWKDGVTLFSRAEAINPENWMAQLGLGMALTERGRFEEALSHLTRPVAFSGNPIEAHQKLGICLFWKGDFLEALTHFKVVLDQDPGSVETCFFVAEILATHPDRTVRNGDRAIFLAVRGLRHRPNASPDQWLTLSSAYAAAGEFREALQAGEHAKALARDQKKPFLVGKIEERLRLFRKQKPFIQMVQRFSLTWQTEAKAAGTS